MPAERFGVPCLFTQVNAEKLLFNWQLKGDKEAAKMFKGDDNLLQKRKDWTLEKNEKFSKLK